MSESLPSADVSLVSCPDYEDARRVRERVRLAMDRAGGLPVEAGDKVFIKPNLVSHEYGRKVSSKTGSLYSVITHPEIVRAVALEVAEKVGADGEILVGDNPTIDADWTTLCEQTGLPDVCASVTEKTGVRCTLLDLRPRWTPDLATYGFRSRTEELAGDPSGDRLVDLAESSYFHGAGINPLLFRGVFNNRWGTIRHHVRGRHRYSISRSVLDADVYISIPKLKTHHKVGVTLNIKGLVGTISDKNTLIHWAIGYPAMGGDEFSSAASWRDYPRLGIQHLAMDLTPEPLYLKLRSLLRATPIPRWFARKKRFDGDSFRGSWAGNRSCWRMAADLHEVLRRSGIRTFSVVDGVLGGQGDGPLLPDAAPAGVLLAGEDLFSVDCAAAQTMGFDPGAVPYLRAISERHGWSLEPTITSELTAPAMSFSPPSGWDSLLPLASR